MSYLSLHVSKLVIWGSSWARGFRFHWLEAANGGQTVSVNGVGIALVEAARSQGGRVSAPPEPQAVLPVPPSGPDSAGAEACPACPAEPCPARECPACLAEPCPAPAAPAGPGAAAGPCPARECPACPAAEPSPTAKACAACPAAEAPPAAVEGRVALPTPTCASAACHALVIGIASYAPGPPLSCVAEGARMVEAALSEAGFRTTLLQDAARKELRAGIQAFAKGVEPGAVVLVYFAGRGLVQQAGCEILQVLTTEVASHTHTCIYIYIYMYVCIYIYIYIYTYPNEPSCCRAPASCCRPSSLRRPPATRRRLLLSPSNLS